MNKTIVLLSGKMGSGKSTLAAALTKHLESQKSVANLKFADIIYEMHDSIVAIGKKYDISFPEKKDRALLQLLGTEWGRLTKGENVWVDAMKAKITACPAEVILIDDLRFVNEFQAFNGPSVIKVRLTCPDSIRKVRTGDAWSDTPHPSETALDGHMEFFDFILNTNETEAEVHATTLANFILKG